MEDHHRTPESSQSSSNPSSSTSTSTTVLIPAKRYHRYPTRSTSDTAISTSSSQPSPSISISAPTTLDTSTYLPPRLRRKAAIPLPFNAADFDNPCSQYDSVYAEPGRQMVTDDVVDLRDTNSAMTVTTMSRARSRSYDDRLDGRGRRARTGNMMGSERMNPDGDAGMSAEHFELVPYSNEWTVILRNDSKGELVLYNAESRAVSVQRMPRRTHMHVGIELSRLRLSLSEFPYLIVAILFVMLKHPILQQMSNPDICLLCRRPFDASNNAESSQPTFMDVNYFRLLAHVTHSPVPSRSTSPTSSPLPSRSTSPTGSTRPSTPTSSVPTSATPASSTASGGFRAHLNVKALNQGYYERFFVEGRKLGRGFRGSVFLCQHILDQVYLGEYAIKKVAVGDNHAWLVRMLREVHLLEKLHHPNIVDYKHAWLEEHKLTQFGPQVPCLFILMECANGGNLEEYIETPPITIPTATSTPTTSSVPPEFRAKNRARLLRRQDAPSPAASLRVDRRWLALGEVWSLFLDTCEGLAHLHRHNIVHRDLKPPNLLLNWEDGIRLGRTPRVLISDFGECEVLDELTDRDRTGATGTLEFMAPELVKVDERGKYLRDFSPKSDMWSLGMVLYYLCYSVLPYRQVEDVEELKEEILAFHGYALCHCIRYFEHNV
ncbi:kinase-like domain-containing protein [Jimgerdemannia flammicorona]|uniref:non-specific serine/threonine protein kinase n=1 Tax=Jimgerdemannia flammicorona TaxID=994334 RepID=A0A433DNH7_9FUNG|nr:kinase-like domain-containing protein [Jimgerdemannia flammicorona]